MRTALIVTLAAVVTAAAVLGVVWYQAQSDPYGGGDDLARYFKDDAPATGAVAAGQMPLRFIDTNGSPFDVARYRGQKSVVLVFVRGLPFHPTQDTF
jgi:cytochrome oxidase Cu insertion factor (SCO1/SenC/PrrC family)